ncbi:MAG: hypothetical protein ACOZAR_02370 [Patescibacteria group bacterium]
MDKADQLILEQLNKEVPHERTCRVCGGEWKIEQDDLIFLKKFIVPVPKICPSCSMRQKLAWRNERVFYRRKCSATSKEIVSIYSPDKDYQVFDKDFYANENNWNPLDYVMNYDSAESFFVQFAQLMKLVPYASLITVTNKADNCEYVNHGGWSKNCYMISMAAYNENCLFGKNIMHSRDCVENYNINKCESCYENINGLNNNNCQFLYNSQDCFDCHFSAELKNCQNCLLCFNLLDKKYCVRNKQVTHEEFEQERQRLQFTELKAEFFQMRARQVVKFANIVNSENCSGDYINNSKDSLYCFGVEGYESCKYCFDGAGGLFDCYNIYSSGNKASLEYNSLAAPGSYNVICSSAVGNNSQRIGYSLHCYGCSDIFGCIGLKNKQYCVLNKQYSKQEYERIVEEIKLDMLSRDEYGEFFPANISWFGYNETIAQEYFPLNKEEAQKLGFKWSGYEAEGKFDGPFYEPLEIKEYFNEQKAKELLAGILQCEVTGKPYKIMGPELAFYLKHNIPIPKRSPNQRHKDRMALKNPYKLWHRQCMCEGQLTINRNQLTGENGCQHQGRCINEFETTYAPERTEKVYCEECYRKSVL